MSFPFEHIEKSSTGLVTQKSLVELQKSRCFRISCTERACIERSSGDTKYSSCLLHFVSEVDATEIVAEGNVRVIDQQTLISQIPQTNELWMEAIAEVVLEMYNLQREEEEVIRKDPLSILGMNNPKHRSSLAKMHGSAAAEKLSVINESESSGVFNSVKSAKRKAETVSDPYQRIAQRRDDGNLSAIEANAKDLQEETEAEKKVRLADEEKKANGLPCQACGSRWTETRTISMVENSRSETWGFKDALSSYSVACNKCKHIGTFTE